MIKLTIVSENKVDNDGAEAPRRTNKKPKPEVLESKHYYVWKCPGNWDRFDRIHDDSCGQINVKSSILQDGNRDHPFMGLCEKCNKNTRMKTSGNSKIILEVFRNKQAAYAYAYGRQQSLELEGEEE